MTDLIETAKRLVERLRKDADALQNGPYTSIREAREVMRESADTVTALREQVLAVTRELDEEREKTRCAVTVGGGLVVYGTVEAVGRVQDYILLDSTHPVEKEDVRRTLMRQLQAAEARAERAEALVVTLAGPLEAYVRECERQDIKLGPITGDAVEALSAPEVVSLVAAHRETNNG